MPWRKVEIMNGREGQADFAIALAEPAVALEPVVAVEPAVALELELSAELAVALKPALPAPSGAV
jgi:hypothetical protein